MGAMIDTSDVVKEWLVVEGTGLHTRVGTHVATPVAPAGFNDTDMSAAAAIVFHPASEQVHPTAVDKNDNIYVFKCYGGSSKYSDARAVFRALVDRLHGVTGGETASGRIERSDLISGQMGPPEPGTTRPVHISQFQIMITGET